MKFFCYEEYRRRSKELTSLNNIFIFIYIIFYIYFILYFILINRQSNKKFYDPTHLETMDAIGWSNLCNGIVSLVVLTIGHLVIIVSKMRNSLSSEVKAKDR